LLATALVAFALLLPVAIAAPSVPELIHVHAVSQGAMKPTPVSICNGWGRSYPAGTMNCPTIWRYGPVTAHISILTLAATDVAII
jgi:hypothetical protein